MDNHRQPQPGVSKLVRFFTIVMVIAGVIAIATPWVMHGREFVLHSSPGDTHGTPGDLGLYGLIVIGAYLAHVAFDCLIGGGLGLFLIMVGVITRIVYGRMTHDGRPGQETTQPANDRPGDVRRLLESRGNSDLI